MIEAVPQPAHILGMRVDATTYEQASNLLCGWAQQKASKYVCVANVFNVMSAHDSRGFREVTNEADLVTPDGMPLVWCLKLLGHSKAVRVYGPDLTLALLDMSASLGLSVGFYGAASATLQRLQDVVRNRYPNLRIAYACSPPFRPLTADEDDRIVEDINRADVGLLFVGLGTPKQDYWMAAHKNRVQSVMVGVGAAFDFLSGTKSQAPRWMMRIGMEWLFRLLTEPRRLWKRYLKTNPRLVLLFTLQLLGLHFATDGGNDRD